ncbi:MAG: Vi polysaccharide biosynthesis protein VipA/TviB [Pelagibacteraceae bacterium TMED65]|nr:MAG: Vi polysaccharide biosynthesis protein VipA/TviB [Pelagibacteraceae bacterium TMED65]|tara:strand:+ start:3104 stop:4390 length:1287 start_codon:yes stop_codon:yes gene_type:complete
MKKKFNLKNIKIAIIGLGYVGLPLAVEFGKKFPVVGYDINNQRIKNLKKGIDDTLETSKRELNDAIYLKYSNNHEDMKSQNCFIITVPTPINSKKKPDLSLLINATEIVGKLLKKEDLVIYESTVYPGVTEEICVPILEKTSNLIFNQSFFCGYSPERINPGDKEHRLANITKVTSGSTPETADIIDLLYNKIIKAGTFKAKSIKVAEAAKVIENTQRDINIALINELAIIFNRLGIDTQSVLKAAQSKWNFLKFSPGLVGGHCIGVDPFYLTHKSKEVGYLPKVILAGRRLNDGMSSYVVSELVKFMIKKKLKIYKARVLIMGLAFKENCPDYRNTRVLDIIKHLKDYGLVTEIYDPWVDSERVKQEHKINIINNLKDKSYESILIAVAHNQFHKMGSKKIRKLLKKNGIIYDLKGIFAQNESDIRL